MGLVLSNLVVTTAACLSLLQSHWQTIVLGSAFLFAMHRERGQEHGWIGTQAARALFWATPVTLLVAWLVPDVWPAWSWQMSEWDPLIRVWLAAMLGMALLPHSAGQNLVETPAAYPWSWTAKIPKPQKLGYLWLAGIARLQLIAWALEPSLILPASWSVVGGLSVPAGYLLGTVMPPLRWRLTSKGEWGEAFAGAGYGLALTVGLITTLAL